MCVIQMEKEVLRLLKFIFNCKIFFKKLSLLLFPISRIATQYLFSDLIFSMINWRVSARTGASSTFPKDLLT